MRVRPTLGLALTASLLLLGACGDDDHPPPVNIVDSSRPDAGLTDGGGREDSATNDGDVSSDATTDASSEGDGGGGNICRPTSLPIAFLQERAGEDVEVAAAPGVDGFVLAWTYRDEEGHHLWVQHISSNGDRDDAHELTQDADATSRAPVVVSVDDHWLVAWSDNSSGQGYEIYVRALDDEGAPMGGTATRLSTNMLGDNRPSLVHVDDGVVAFWIRTDMDGLSPVIVRQRLSESGGIVGGTNPLTEEEHAPADLVGDVLVDGSAVLWVENAGTSHIRLQNVDASGNADGEIETLSTEGNAQGSFDFVGSEAGGAVAFGALREGFPEIRFRLVNEDGAPSGLERILTMAPEAADSPAIAAFAGGYLIAYRHTAPAPAYVRIATVDSAGNVLERADISDELTSDTVRVLLRVASDGTGLLAWASLAEDKDVDASITTRIGFDGILVRCD